MKRKIAKIGPSTLMVSLPSKWAKLHNLSKGDEIELTEEQNKIILTTHKNIKSTKITVDISNLPSSLIWHFLKSTYRQGTDEIKVIFKNEKVTDRKTNQVMKTRELIQIISDQLIGMEIIREEKDYCILKEISDIKREELENILNRIFISLLNLVETSIEAIKNKDKETLENIFKFTDKNINKFTDFCFRILNKTQQENSNSHYLIIAYLEEIGDSLIRINKKIYENFNKELIEDYKSIGDVLKILYKTYYKFNKESIIVFYEARDKIRVKLTKKDPTVILMRTALSLMMEVVNARITINNLQN